ncbi:MAG: cation:proton antiporter [Chloroflexia bacterium]|nr:cation:proton antiporter [Chloroflexia bacterium]
MTATYWFLIAGALLVSIAFTSPLLARFPISTSNIYLLVGLIMGPGVIGLVSWDAVREARLLEHLTEIAVIVSLFTVGLNIRRSPGARSWLLPLRLASLTMVLTIAAVALIGVLLLDLPLGAAVLLGAVLAPTDPVLASDVQVRGVTDRDTLRSGLSGEAGLNDGTAFPFVMLGLGLLGLHPDEEAGFLKLWAGGQFDLISWFLWDIAWAVPVGIAIGLVTGWLVGQAVLRSQRRHDEVVGLHEFLVLGLIALSYGLAELVYGYGFLAVFSAGYALRLIELRSASHAEEPAELPTLAPGDHAAGRQIAVAEAPQAAQFLTVSLLNFNYQLEHLLEAGVVVLLGGVLTRAYWTFEVLWLAPLLLLVVRPLSVWLGLLGSDAGPAQRAMIGWFGIRGVGSLYYLTYAIEHGLPDDLARRLTGLVLSLVAVSIVVHGISVTPLMRRYEALVQHREVGE